MPVNTSITFRKGSATQWSNTNPVLASGEPGYDLTNNILKIGDGVSAWNSLSNHSHSSSDITNFNSSVSGLLPAINNSGNNRILTSTGSSIGINAEDKLTFDGTTFVCSGEAKIGDPTYQYLELFNGVVYIKDGEKYLIDCEESRLVGDNNIDSIKWQERSLYDNTGSQILNWSSGIIVPTGKSINLQNVLVIDDSNFLYLYGGVNSGLISSEDSSIDRFVFINGSIENSVIGTSSGNFTNLKVNNVNVSVSGHTHLSSDITNFNIGVSGLVSGIYAPLSGKLNQFSSTSSSELASIISDETGSGLLVFNNSPNFIGIPTVPTANSGTNTNQIASTSFVRTEISNLVNSAPSTLDTLNELALALGNDSNFSTTITNSLAGKANLSGASFTGTITAPTGNFTTLQQNSVAVSISGHTHTTSDITDFSTVPINGGQIQISYSNDGINLDTDTTAAEFLYRIQNDGVNTAIGAMGGVTSSNISNFNSSVSGLVSGIYQPLLTNPVTGVGTSGYYTKWNGSNSVTSGIIFDNGTNIGIGTTTPSGQLHVVGTGIISSNLSIGSSATPRTVYISGAIPTQGELLRLQNGTSTNNSYLDIGIGTVGNYDDHVIFYRGTGTGSNTRIFGIDNSNRLLGFVNWAMLGNTDIASYNNANAYIKLQNTSTNNLQISAVNGILFQSQSSTRMTMDSTGNLGIGTTTPSGQLHVVGTGVISDRLGIGINNPSGSLNLINTIRNDCAPINVSSAVLPTRTHIGLGNSDTNPFLSSLNGGLSSSNYGWGFFDRNTEGDFRLARKAGSSSWIDTISIPRINGFVGIGTTTPSGQLHVIGTGIISSRLGVNTSSPTNQLHVVGTGLIASVTGLPANALLDVYSTTSGEMVFNVEGTNGSLFSVIDNLSGSLMSVNNNAGLPIFEVFSNDSIIAGRFNQNDFVISSGGNIGIGKAVPSVKLDIVGGVAVSGAFAATTKSFKIDHPSKSNYTLEYGSLESPYHGVRLTGRGVVSKGKGIVELPDYLKELIHNDDSINIQLTNLYHDKILYVSNIDLINDRFEVCAKRAKTLYDLQFCWTLTGIRKDVEHLQVERNK